MLDLERAFSEDNHRIFFRTEIEMPYELLEDAYKLFWQSIEDKKYNVAVFLMRKPYFEPFIRLKKPKNWISLLCANSEMISLACEFHIHPAKIRIHEAISLLHIATKMHLASKKGIDNLIDHFDYQDFDSLLQSRVSSLLKSLMGQQEWYWVEKMTDWGVKFKSDSIDLWAKEGLGLNTKNVNFKNWPTVRLRHLRKDLTPLLINPTDEVISAIVANNHMRTFARMTKLLPSKQHRGRLIRRVIQEALLQPSSEFSTAFCQSNGKLVAAVFRPNEEWAKKIFQKKKLWPIEKFILEEKSTDLIEWTAKESPISLSSIENDLKSINNLPKWKRALSIRYMANECGLEAVVPKITRKKQLLDLVCDEYPPYEIMIHCDNMDYRASLMALIGS